jgi:glutamyl-tRNA reductase
MEIAVAAARAGLYVPAERLRSLTAEAARSGEAIALATCRRTEIYVAGTDAAAAAERLGDSFAVETGARAAGRLFRVAAGLDSPVLGEGEILRQIREAWAEARRDERAGVVLNRLVRDALHAGKRVRSETEIGRGAPTYAATVVEAVLAEGVQLDGASVLVVGAGAIATSVAHALRARGAAIVVASRTRANAERLATQCGGTAVPLAELAAVAARADVVVTAASSERYLVGAYPARATERPLLLVDLGVPPNVDPAIAAHPACRLLDLDALIELGRARASRTESAVDAAAAIVEQELERFEDWRSSRAILPELTLLRRRAHAILDHELQRESKRLGRLGDDDRRAVEAFATRVVNSLIHLPTVRLKEEAATGQGELYAHAIRRLFAEDAA